MEKYFIKKNIINDYEFVSKWVVFTLYIMNIICSQIIRNTTLFDFEKQWTMLFNSHLVLCTMNLFITLIQ